MENSERPHGGHAVAAAGVHGADDARRAVGGDRGILHPHPDQPVAEAISRFPRRRAGGDGRDAVGQNGAGDARKHAQHRATRGRSRRRAAGREPGEQPVEVRTAVPPHAAVHFT